MPGRPSIDTADSTRPRAGGGAGTLAARVPPTTTIWLLLIALTIALTAAIVLAVSVGAVCGRHPVSGVLQLAFTPRRRERAKEE